MTGVLYGLALILLMGNINWWMPDWMERLIPHVSIEGAEFFLARDQSPATDDIFAEIKTSA